MPLISTKDVALIGISCCVPENEVSNLDYEFLSIDERLKFIEATGIKFRRICRQDQTAADLCFSAADKLLNDIKWDRQEIDILLFVSQMRDFILPSTSIILQDRLGLSTNCMAMDIPLGCSGYVYGLATITGLLSSLNLRKGLLLVGDSISKATNQSDKSTTPLFGDAGTATAFEFRAGAPPMYFDLGSDGSQYKSILIPDGGMRNIYNPESEIEYTSEEGLIKRSKDLSLDGMNVFTFGITQAPKTVLKLLDYSGYSVESVDYFVFHQANHFMNEKIRKKLKIPPEKVPYSLFKYANTSGATIPLTIVSELSNEYSTKKLNSVLCGFGVGLSWGTAFVTTDSIICPKIIEC